MPRIKVICCWRIAVSKWGNVVWHCEVSRGQIIFLLNWVHIFLFVIRSVGASMLVIRDMVWDWIEAREINRSWKR